MDGMGILRKERKGFFVRGGGMAACRERDSCLLHPFASVTVFALWACLPCPSVDLGGQVFKLDCGRVTLNMAMRMHPGFRGLGSLKWSETIVGFYSR